MQAGTGDDAYPVQDSSGTGDVLWVTEIERYHCHSLRRITSLSLSQSRLAVVRIIIQFRVPEFQLEDFDK